MGLRDLLDEVGLILSKYESAMGTKQSFNYDVRHFYKKLYFNPGINIDEKDQWIHSGSTELNNIIAQERKETLAVKENSKKKTMLRQKTISVNNPFYQPYNPY